MQLFDHYSLHSAYDEMFHQDGTVREHWKNVYENIQRAGVDVLEAKQSEIEWHMEDNGVTYNVYNNPDGNNIRPWTLDPIPFVMTQEEWSEVKRGIKQRAKLLNLILRDLYGEQKLLKENIIPSEVIFGHKGFSPEVFNFGLKEHFNLYFYALDMARGPDGKIWVINDRTQAPSGLGYAVENRLTMNMISKELYPNIESKKLSLFVEEFKKLLKKLTHGDTSKAALLTPGPHNETYFEHAYLSSFLEINLVQGDDLLAKNGSLWLKSLSGLKPINTLLRRVDDRFCDPLELRNDSKLGVSGLVDTLRQGHLNMINPIGSAIVENAGLNPFMSRICHYFLDEELILPQIATWWCGQKQELAYVLEHLEHLIIKKIDRTEVMKTYIAKYLSPEELVHLREKLCANPDQYVAQEEISFSKTPCYDNGKIEPRNAVIRAYSVKNDTGYSVMNGGLVRLSISKDALLVSSQKGGKSKDLWILGTDKKADTNAIFKTLPYLDLSIKHMPTLKAENLFWLGRYLARSIATTRLIRYIIKKMIHAHRYESTSSKEVQSILHIALTHFTMTYPGFLDLEEEETPKVEPFKEIASLVRDTYRQGSLSFTISMLGNANLAVKSLLTIESWKLFDKMQKEWHTFIHKSTYSSQTLLHELDKELIYLMAYKELVEESMVSDQGLVLYSIGFKIESALLLISKARSLLCLKLEKSSAYDILEAILGSCESFNAYRTQYKSSLALENVVEFLLLNPHFPKSLTHIADELLQAFKTLPKAKKYLSSYEEAIFKAHAKLRLSHLTTLMEIEEESTVYHVLDTFLSELSELFAHASIEFSKTYFSHYDE
jgi:uncharacterized circularly permuted ATP-grasp superfamily protein/uncharacterized alpha-E superfamily protein